jgi:uncharacterized protein GlcG (DUF336 family)
MAISQRKARIILKKAFEAARASELKPIAVIILDAGGHVSAFDREDGTSPGRFAVAYGKAYGAVMMGSGSSALHARAEAQPYFVTALNGLFGGNVVPVPGGVLVRDKRGEVIGAVGVTGDTSDNDAAAAVAGIEGAGFTAES